MNPREVAYWDRVGVQAIASRKENIFKRTALVRYLLKRPPVNEKVLEIGCGKGFTAAAVSIACCGTMDYTATELAPSFIGFAESFGLKVVQTDVSKLPDGPFDQVWALDTLEHVKKEDRPQGFSEIDRVLGKTGFICLNLPLAESLHVGEFEHGITDEVVTDLAGVCKARVVQWETYRIPLLNIPYAFVVLAR